MAEQPSSSPSTVQDEFKWKGWTVGTLRDKIYNNDYNCLKRKSHVVWKSELGLTRFSNQDLPEALWGSNLLSLHHTESDTTIYFCAMEALRSWLLLDQEPIPHLSGKKPDAWDYTFTTPYAGSVTRGEMVMDATIQPDGSSIYQTSTDVLAKGAVQLRKPLCKCIGGRLLCAGVVKSMEDEKRGGARNGSLTLSSLPSNIEIQPRQYLPLPVEKWEITNEGFDMEDLLKTETQPLYYTKPILFWVQNLDPHSYSSLIGHALVGKQFLVWSLRCFVRVNGVRVRLLDTKFSVRAGNTEVVLRERSWREGTWAEYTGLVGTGKVAIDLGSDLEQAQRAARRLKHKFPPIVEKLVLKAKQCETSVSIRDSTTTTLWTKVLCNSINGEEAVSCSRFGIIVLLNNKMVAFHSHSTVILWERNIEGGLSVKTNCDGQILVGDDQGAVYTFQWCNKENRDDYSTFSFKESESNRSKMKCSKRIQNTSLWVERVAWSENGQHFAAAAGKKVMVDGKIIEMEGTVYAISFLRNEQLVVAVYGGFTIWSVSTAKLAVCRKFDVGASAVIACAVSSDANSIAVGCLDKYARIFQRNRDDSWSTRDWVGFDGGVSLVSWSSDHQYLAVLGGSILLVAKRDAKPGEAPLLCSCWSRNTESDCRFKSISWAKTNILIASTDYHLHVFDVRATNDRVLRRCYPIESMRIEKGDSFFLTDNTEGEIVLWGGRSMRKVKIGCIEKH